MEAEGTVFHTNISSYQTVHRDRLVFVVPHVDAILETLT